MLSTPNANPGNRSNAITARSVQGEVKSFLILRSPTAPGPYARSPVVTRKLYGSLTADVDGGGHVACPRQPAGEEIDRGVMAPDEQAFLRRGIAREPASERAGVGLLVGVPARDAAPEGVGHDDQRGKHTGQDDERAPGPREGRP